MEQIATQEPMIRRAMTIEDVFMKNEEDRRLYELREKGRRDFDNAMITAEKRGRMDVARNMLEENISVAIIKRTTGLSEKELLALQK